MIYYTKGTNVKISNLDAAACFVKLLWVVNNKISMSFFFANYFNAKGFSVSETVIYYGNEFCLV